MLYKQVDGKETRASLGVPFANREPARWGKGGGKAGARKNHSLRENRCAVVEGLAMSECTAMD